MCVFLCVFVFCFFVLGGGGGGTLPLKGDRKQMTEVNTFSVEAYMSHTHLFLFSFLHVAKLYASVVFAECTCLFPVVSLPLRNTINGSIF